MAEDWRLRLAPFNFFGKGQFSISFVRPLRCAISHLHQLEVDDLVVSEPQFSRGNRSTVEPILIRLYFPLLTSGVVRRRCAVEVLTRIGLKLSWCLWAMPHLAERAIFEPIWLEDEHTKALISRLTA
jgi:hypothetical protein